MKSRYPIGLLLVAFLSSGGVDAAAKISSGSSSYLQGSVRASKGEAPKINNNNDNTKSKNGQYLGPRRILQNNMEFDMILEELEYQQTVDHPGGYSEQKIIAVLSDEWRENHHTKLKYLDVVDVNGVIKDMAFHNNKGSHGHLENREKMGGHDHNGADSEGGTFVAGLSKLHASQSIIDIEDGMVFFPFEADVSVETVEEADERRLTSVKRGEREVSRSIVHRKLAANKGNAKTLMIRVTDAAGVSPNKTASELYEDVYTDAVSLKSQYAACSYNQLIVNAADGTNTGFNGIYDLRLPTLTITEGMSKSTLQSAAFEAAYDEIGDLPEMFDLVLFCMPSGTGNWLAYAFVDNMFSFYNNIWCSSVSALLHEVGHNLGLAHSGEDGEGLYNDQSGLMGFSYDEDDTLMCFNPAKSWQLGWYDSDKNTKSIKPENDLADGGKQEFVFGGVTDYKKHPDRMVVLQLHQAEKIQTLVNENGADVWKEYIQDYYIGYNRATGINAGTKEDANTVLVIRKESGEEKEYGQSTKVAALTLGESYTIPNWNNEEGRGIRIELVGQLDAYATVEVRDIKKAPVPIQDTTNCENYVFELKTDSYPTDNKWTIKDPSNGRLVHSGKSYTKGETVYEETVCLPYSRCYEYTLLDEYGDGLCCGQGSGYYQAIKDGTDTVVFKGGFVAETIPNENFKIKTEQLCVGDNPAASNKPDSEDVAIEEEDLGGVAIEEVDSEDVAIEEVEFSACKDASGKKLKMFDKKKDKDTKFNCKKVKKKKLCNEMNKKKNAPAWHACPVKCDGKYDKEEAKQVLGCTVQK